MQAGRRTSSRAQIGSHTKNGDWMVGNNTSSTSGWWMARCAALTPDRTMQKWEVWDDTGSDDWVDAVSAKVVAQVTYEQDVQQRARALGDVVLVVGNDSHQSGCDGIYELQGEGNTLVQGRPTYKKRGPGKTSLIPRMATG